MVQRALLAPDRSGLKRLADDLAGTDKRFSYEHKRVENPSGYIADTLRAVFQSLFATGSFETALVDVVNRGGDADTTGAILGMIAGALYGPGRIPRRWVSALDGDVRAACQEQARALLRLSPLCRVSEEPRGAP
jgi:ADP-ribosyl-[dinitrogen reductase] hydrolase